MNWIQEIDAITSETEILFNTLSREQLHWKPDSQIWSIAQNLDHVIVVNTTYFPILTALHKGTYKKPFMANVGCMVSFLEKTVLHAVQPDRKKKMKTFPIWEPSPRDVEDDIVLRFKKHQSELKKHINEAKDLLNMEVVISSPANRYFVYSLKTAFDIIVTHEKRHVEQAKELLNNFTK